MKRLSILLLLAVVHQRSAFAQGPLTPAGPPGPTMITLSQVEPRTPISTAVIISSSGSYYLTTNITVASGGAITINASGVTLDLNGFTISSTDASESGFGIALGTVSAVSDITILNGHITSGVNYSGGSYSGGGFGYGITYGADQPVNVRVSGVSVSGCLYLGIYLGTGNSTVVDYCRVQTIGGYGIKANSVTHSTAYQCGNTAITADTASDCYGYSTGGNGFTVSQTANNCCGYSLTGDGLSANNAINCSGVSSNSTGLSATQTATGCSGQSSGFGDGLYSYNANNCYGVCNLNGDGLFAVNTAIGCYGQTGSGTGLQATIGNSSYGWKISGGIESEIVSYKYNMP